MTHTLRFATDSRAIREATAYEAEYSSHMRDGIYYSEAQGCEVYVTEDDDDTAWCQAVHEAGGEA